MSDVLFVLGMHRSGTSAFAGTLTKLGGATPRRLMGADEGNARGYFESVAFMELHDDLLASAGSQWDDWRQFNPGWYRSPAVAGYKQRAKELFEAEFGGSALPVLKDPRICRFMAFWIEVLREMQKTPCVAIPIRSPLDVAQSLKKRYGFSLSKGLLLWLRHNLDAEAQTRDLARSIVAWSDFLSDWRSVCDKVAADTNLSWPRASDRTSREIDRFLSKQLVHHETDHAALAAHSDVHEWTLRAYEALLELARNPFSNSAMDALDEVRASLDKSGNLFGRVLVDYEAEIEELRNQSRTLTSESEDRARIAAEIQKQLTESEERRQAAEADRAAERDKLSADLLTMSSELQRGRLAMAERVSAWEAAQADLAAARTEAAALKEKADKTLEEKQKFADDLERLSSETEARIRALRGELVDAEAALSRAGVKRAQRSGLGGLLPTAFRRRALARRLVRCGLMDPAWYRRTYPDVAASGLSPAEHYVETGFSRGYRPNPFFDTRWYLERYEDVRRSGVNPLLHYHTNGWREGRDPGPDFQTKFYLESNPDVSGKHLNPLAHYLHYGRHEGRLPAQRR